MMSRGNVSRLSVRVSVLLVAGVAALGIGAPASASVVGVTSEGALGANDSINWGQLGSSDTLIPDPSAVTSALGKSATLSSGGGIGLSQAISGLSSGGFTNGEWVVDSQFVHSLTITFANPVSSIGAQLDATSSGTFTGEIMALDGATVLGSFSEVGTSNETTVQDGSNIFIGVKSTSADITSVEFALQGPGNIAIGTAYLADGVPEPAAWTLMLLGFGGLGVALRNRPRRGPLPTA